MTNHHKIILNDTELLTKSKYIPNLLSESDIQTIMHEIHNCFTSFSHRKEIPVLRAYIDGRLDYSLQRLLKEYKFYEIENFEEDIKECIGFGNFCITFNGITKWNSKIHSFLSNNLVNGFVRNLGTPLIGLDTYCFIGNYGFTPFGIHDDNDHSLLFHLGPNSKRVWVWERDEYRKITGSELISFEYKKYLNTAKEIILEPGDFIFIKNGDFHVFDSTDFSITFGVTIFPSSKEVLYRESLRKYFESYNFEDSSYFSKKINIEKGNIEDNVNIRNLYSRYLNIIESNNYITNEPLIKYLKFSYNSNFKKFPNCPLIYRRWGQTTEIYSRGRVITISTSFIPFLDELIAYINTGEEFTVQQLVDMYVKSSEHDSINQLINALVETSGVIKL
ncbi:hypothetical protein VINI7043_07085 [Vibrio nigripulchritudo ATCC 27043]|uniref:hypothetical protein n=1 Tax=Vibrio nigripulchritudo TaxID=28173 RepID=UPI00021C14F0|nr:hypothetical protein [Vibrio nigripulchritudo]EGU57559.1 hypothetical protein VINI7043_07085 [Vibrio nigripulchritudo ATCC 27043]